MAFLLHQLLTESARRAPQQMAVAGPGGALTYGELDRLSNQIAQRLHADGVRPGDRVGIFLAKSIQAVAALLGVQKAGAAYVPIDPHAPPHRAAYILSNCGVRALITSADNLTVLPKDFFEATPLVSVLLAENASTNRAGLPAAVPVVTLEEVQGATSSEDPAIPITDNDLAYILYTSGSTGEPKGVMISHLNSLTFVNWCYDTFGVIPDDRVSSHAPFHFDLSVFDIFCTLKAGATLYLVPPSITMFPVELARWISENRISIWYSVPSALIQLVERGRLERYSYSDLRLVLFAGEVFPIKYQRRFCEAVAHPDYYNLYGPTETNVCTYYKVQPADLAADRARPVPIGKPCANSHVIAVNERMQPIAADEEGELYVRSATVMKGYWGRPQDTAKVVVQDFTRPHVREVLYRTGDIVRLMPSGDYDYIGRRDKMIKSRGYRIELGEIEAALYAHPSVKEAAVIALPDEDIGARIKACVVVSERITRAQLEQFCCQRLPRYMMPEIVEFRDALPKTSTGKVDKTSIEKETALACQATQ